MGPVPAASSSRRAAHSFPAFSSPTSRCHRCASRPPRAHGDAAPRRVNRHPDQQCRHLGRGCFRHADAIRVAARHRYGSHQRLLRHASGPAVFACKYVLVTFFRRPALLWGSVWMEGRSAGPRKEKTTVPPLEKNNFSFLRTVFSPLLNPPPKNAEEEKFSFLLKYFLPPCFPGGVKRGERGSCNSSRDSIMIGA